MDIHSIHPYPCKFPPQSVVADLEPGKVFLDPFCGSGTALLEAKRRGMSVIGVDCNPIATLISRVKVCEVSTKVDLLLDSFVEDVSRDGGKSRELKLFPGRDHWFSPGSQQGMAVIVEKLDQLKVDPTAWDIAAVALSSIVNRFSNQDSETRYARVERQFSREIILDTYLRRVADVRLALAERGALPRSNAIVYTEDLMEGLPLPAESVDLVFTSPPYANTMDYYLYHKQRMNILGYDFKQVQHAEIGSRHEFSSKKSPIEKWTSDYAKSLSELFRVLKPGGQAFVVIGDSQVSGNLVDALKMTEAIAIDLGFVFEVVASDPMTGRSRTFNSKFQRPNKREHVILLTVPKS